METKQVTMFVVVNKNNKPELYTLRQSKRECIATFETFIEAWWKDIKKFGWKCIKVDVTISPMSNEPSWL